MRSYERWDDIVLRNSHTTLNDDENLRHTKNFLRNSRLITKSNMHPHEEIKSKLKKIGSNFMENLFDIWKNSAMKNMTLTSVGIAIAQANFRRKTGLSLDLDIWIRN